MRKRFSFTFALLALASTCAWLPTAGAHAGVEASSRPHAGLQQQGGRLVGVIGITREIAPVEARVAWPMIERISGVVFTSGTVNGLRIVAVRSGIGKVNAAMAATLLVDHFSPAAVVFSGTAGAIDPELNPGDVVVGTAVGHHDFGRMTADRFIRTLTRDPASGQLDPALFPAGPDLLAAARRAAGTVSPSLPPDVGGAAAPRIREGVILTGDAFMASPALRNELRRDLKASAVEMEGAAVAQICARFGVPLVVIRSITDRADGQAEGSYQRFVDVAARNAADLALATIREFLK